MTVAENLRKKSYRRSKSHFQAYFVTRFQYENNRYDSKLQFDNVDQLLLGCRYLFFFLNNCVKLRWRGHKCEHSLSIIYVTLCQHYDYYVTCENHNFHPEIEKKSENKDKKRLVSIVISAFFVPQNLVFVYHKAKFQMINF